ncbi:Aste57867_1724 [Aphanomyces stellatus]|uniref:Aste57867_1724 protein n=1 Tax=Aphanomyces stellatus TaxID=120398 RepID=A0A485KA52_9STRA|nr:hypothetical protein As57867_001722 [Aphanomyces stellatus]VFT78935.1 Aste57867_1724 [Aphanomyces stellatus]
MSSAFSMRSLLNPSHDSAVHHDDILITTKLPLENRASSDRKRRHERAKARYNEEMTHLHDKCQALEDKLLALESNKKFKIQKHSKSPWEGFARRQAWKRQQSMMENGKLKMQLETQLSIIRDLQAVLTKQPQLLDAPPVGSGTLSVRLGLDPIERKQTISDMLQHQLHRMDDVFAENGLVESQDSWKQLTVRYDDTAHELVFEKSLSLIFNVPIGVLCSGLHSTVNRVREHATYFNGSSDTLEVVDANTLYRRRVYKLDDGGVPDIHVNFIFHTSGSADSYVWIGQSVLEDELHPFPDNVFRSRESIWCVAEPISATQSRLKKVRHIHLAPPREQDLGSVCPVGALADILISVYAANTDLFTSLVEKNVLEYCPEKPEVLVESAGPIIQLNQFKDGSSRTSSSAGSGSPRPPHDVNSV